jgi:hypothetical protein
MHDEGDVQEEGSDARVFEKNWSLENVREDL